jgi:hypothetical protein
VPILDDERQNERDQQKVEEIEHVADCRRGEYLPLVDGELFLPLQIFEHRFAPPTPIFDCAVVGGVRLFAEFPASRRIVRLLPGDGNKLAQSEFR